MSSPLITKFRKGFSPGRNSVTQEGEENLDTGIDFEIIKQPRDIEIDECDKKEVVWLLMAGEAEIQFQGETHTVRRTSLFDEPPTALHLGPETPVQIKAVSDNVEWAVSRAENKASFESRLFTPKDVVPEFRGMGLVQNTCLRNVRLIFDKTIRPESNLVIGEVINLPGRWSSYPPHHHAQPEIYHYRFTEPQGYGHGELGEDVYKIKDKDTIKIIGGIDHSQCSAPGYGMYYLWIVRHLDGNPYTGFEFTEEHKWLLDENNKGWEPKEFPKG